MVADIISDAKNIFTVDPFVAEVVKLEYFKERTRLIAVILMSHMFYSCLFVTGKERPSKISGKYWTHKSFKMRTTGQY